MPIVWLVNCLAKAFASYNPHRYVPCCLFRHVVKSRSVLGNPSVILIDEFSTGIDARMKYHMWGYSEKAIIVITFREWSRFSPSNVTNDISS